jgi:hypothetical protein
MLLAPVLQGLLTLLVALTAATAIVGATAPQYLTRGPARPEAIRVNLLFCAVVSLLVLVVLWSGYLPAWVKHVLGWTLLGVFIGGAVFLPRTRQPWRFSIGALVGALFLGGACWGGALDFWNFVVRETSLPTFSLPRWVEIPLAIAFGAWLQHRFTEIWMRTGSR